MKKVLSYSPIAFGIIFFLLPLFKYIALIFDYNFELKNILITSSVFNILLLIILVSLLISKIQINKVSSIFSALLFPFSFICEMVFIFNAEENTIKIIILAFISCAFTFAFLLKFGFSALKISCILMTILLMIFCSFPFLFKFTFGSFRCNTIVKTLTSPGNTYIAEIIDSDQGALGGNTIVEVRRIDRNLNIIIGEFKKNSKRVYSGDYQEYLNMRINWKDENTLVIGSWEYKIND